MELLAVGLPGRIAGFESRADDPVCLFLPD
jgi:hypothetical protein